MSSPSNLLNIARKYAEPHVASNVRYFHVTPIPSI